MSSKKRKTKRDIEKNYTMKEFIKKIRRLAAYIESDK